MTPPPGGEPLCAVEYDLLGLQVPLVGSRRARKAGGSRKRFDVLQVCCHVGVNE
jgi:hypothetical protein